MHSPRRALPLALSLLVTLALTSLPSSATADGDDLVYPTPASLGLAWGQQVKAQAFDEELHAVDESNGVLWSVGESQEENDADPLAIIRRTTTDGVQLNHLIEGDASEPNYATAVDAGSWGAVVAGTNSGVFPGTGETPPNYPEKGWVQLLDDDLDPVWTTGFDKADGNIEVAGVTVADGRVFVVSTSTSEHQNWGFEMDSFDLATGAHLATRTMAGDGYQFLHAVTTADGNVIVGGATTDELVPGAAHSDLYDWRYDAVVMALDPTDLSTVWIQQFGTAGDDSVATLTARDGVVYWGGSAGNFDQGDEFSPSIGAVGALSATDGTPLWQQNLGPESASVRSVTTTSRGIVLGGDIRVGNVIETYLEGRGFDGAAQWHLALAGPRGASGYDTAMGIVAPADRVFFVGLTEGIFHPIDVGPEAVMAALDVADVLQPSLTVGDPQANRAATARGTSGRPAATSAAHTVRIVVRPGSPARTAVQLRNAGLVPDRMTLAGCASTRHLSLRLTHAGHDVTSAVAGGRYVTPRLRVRQAMGFTWHVTADRKAHGVHTCSFRARSVHDAKAVDRRTVTIVVRRSHHGR